MNEGWIKLWRKFTEWEWYKDGNTMRVFIHLLLTANIEPCRFKGYEVGVGCRVIGRKSLSEELNISEKSVRTALKHLKETNEVAIFSTSKFSIVKINNWLIYQQVPDWVNVDK